MSWGPTELHNFRLFTLFVARERTDMLYDDVDNGQQRRWLRRVPGSWREGREQVLGTCHLAKDDEIDSACSLHHEFSGESVWFPKIGTLWGLPAW